MRKAWFATCAATVMVAGCAGSNNTATPSRVATAPAVAPAAQIAAPPAERWYSKWLGRDRAKARPAGTSDMRSADAGFLGRSESPDVCMAMAEMSQRGGNTAHARQLYQKALAAEPDHLGALLGAARFEDRQGNLDVAQMLYQHAAKAHPEVATAHNDFGLCLARRGDIAGARAALERAVKLDPKKPLYRNNLAKVLVELHEMELATSHQLAVHPPAVAHYNMGVLLNQRGRCHEAMNYALTAAAIDPSFAPAHQLLAALQPQTDGAAVVHMPAQPALAPPQTAQSTADSVLPTPHIVATIPWRAGGSHQVPAPPAAADEQMAAAPATTTGNSPALLPPIN